MRKVDGVSRLNAGDVVRILVPDRRRVPWIGQVLDDGDVVCLRGWDAQHWVIDGSTWAAGNFDSLPIAVLEEGDDYYTEALMWAAKVALGVAT